MENKILPDKIAELVGGYLDRSPTSEEWELIANFLIEAHSAGITIDEMIFVTHTLLDASIQIMIDNLEYFMPEEYGKWLDEGGLKRDIPDDPTLSLIGSTMALIRGCLSREPKSPFITAAEKFLSKE